MIRQQIHRAVVALFATVAIGTRTVICIEDLHGLIVFDRVVGRHRRQGSHAGRDACRYEPHRRPRRSVVRLRAAKRRRAGDRARPLDADAVVAVSTVRSLHRTRSHGCGVRCSSAPKAIPSTLCRSFAPSWMMGPPSSKTAASSSTRDGEAPSSGLPARRGRRAYRPARRWLQGDAATGLDHRSPVQHWSVGSARRRERRRHVDGDAWDPIRTAAGRGGRTGPPAVRSRCGTGRRLLEGMFARERRRLHLTLASCWRTNRTPTTP